MLLKGNDFLARIYETGSEIIIARTDDIVAENNVSFIAKKSSECETVRIDDVPVNVLTSRTMSRIKKALNAARNNEQKTMKILFFMP